MQPCMPTSLIVIFVAGNIFIVSNIFINPAPSSTNKRTADAKRAVNYDRIVRRRCGTVGIVLAGLSLIGILLFVIRWFIAGCIWVFVKVQNNQPDKSDYCHRPLHLFGCFSVLLPFICSCLAYCYLCLMAAVTLEIKGNDGAIPVPTTEP